MFKLFTTLGLLWCFASIVAGLAIPKQTKRNQVILISFDGMQSGKFEEFLKDNPNSTFSNMIANGAKAEFMIPSFPTLTFPNHFTLVTGLYIESHGIVGNSIYDPIADKKINFIGDPTAVANDPKWWDQGEPIWLTASQQLEKTKKGLKSGAFFWTGSEVISRTPDIWRTYNSNYPEKVKIDDVIDWVYKLEMDLTVLYFNEPDHEGHASGADSAEYMAKIKQADENIGYLTKRLKDLNIHDDVNIIVVSDHGMATMQNRSTILVQDFVNRTLINATRTIYGVTSNIHPIAGYEKEVYDGLKKIPNARVFYRHEVPEYLHYSSNDRIAPIVVTCDDGYTISTAVQTNKGNHGFDNHFESMRTIFLASGPNFKKNVKIEPFQNVNVYPLLCELTQINCRPHNGSLSVFDDVLQLTRI